MAAIIGAPARILRFGELAPVNEHHTQPERAGCAAPLVGAPVCGLGFCQSALLLEERAEMRRRGAVTVLVGATERRLRSDEVALLLELEPEIERPFAPIRVALHRRGAIRAMGRRSRRRWSRGRDSVTPPSARQRERREDEGEAERDEDHQPSRGCSAPVRGLLPNGAGRGPLSDLADRVVRGRYRRPRLLCGAL
jgi:hypothetical protein